MGVIGGDGSKSVGAITNESTSELWIEALNGITSTRYIFQKFNLAVGYTGDNTNTITGIASVDCYCGVLDAVIVSFPGPPSKYYATKYTGSYYLNGIANDIGELSTPIPIIGIRAYTMPIVRRKLATESLSLSQTQSTESIFDSAMSTVLGGITVDTWTDWLEYGGGPQGSGGGTIY